MIFFFMANIFERGIDKIGDIRYSVQHPNAIVSRSVAKYLDVEFGRPPPQNRGILFELTHKPSKLSPTLRQYIDENI